MTRGIGVCAVTLIVLAFLNSIVIVHVLFVSGGAFLAALALVHFREKPQPAQVARFSIPPPEKGTFDMGGGADIPAIRGRFRDRSIVKRGGEGGIRQDKPQSLRGSARLWQETSNGHKQR